tara:strand:+ start:374 stop:547 length:174 start_codon:yes stop_codon:yes gene_type:complete
MGCSLILGLLSGPLLSGWLGFAVVMVAAVVLYFGLAYLEEHLDAKRKRNEDESGLDN